MFLSSCHAVPSRSLSVYFTDGIHQIYSIQTHYFGKFFWLMVYKKLSWMHLWKKKSNCCFHTIKIYVFPQAWPRYSKMLSMRVSKYSNKQRLWWRKSNKLLSRPYKHNTIFRLQLNRSWCVTDLICSPFFFAQISPVLIRFCHLPSE